MPRKNDSSLKFVVTFICLAHKYTKIVFLNVINRGELQKTCVMLSNKIRILQSLHLDLIVIFHVKHVNLYLKWWYTRSNTLFRREKTWLSLSLGENLLSNRQFYCVFHHQKRFVAFSSQPSNNARLVHMVHVKYNPIVFHLFYMVW